MSPKVVAAHAAVSMIPVAWTTKAWLGLPPSAKLVRIVDLSCQPYLDVDQSGSGLDPASWVKAVATQVLSHVMIILHQPQMQQRR